MNRKVNEQSISQTDRQTDGHAGRKTDKDADVPAEVKPHTRNDKQTSKMRH